MRRVILLLICAFVFSGINATAQHNHKEGHHYSELDEHPTFKGGGPNNFAYWVATHVKYPKYAKEAGIEGTVMVHFIIDTNGKISDAHVHQSVHPVLDAEAVRIIKKSPKWKPGKKDGKPVKVGFNMPVAFNFTK